MAPSPSMQILISFVGISVLTVCFVTYKLELFPMPGLLRAGNSQYSLPGSTPSLNASQLLRIKQRRIRTREFRQMFKHIEPLYRTPGVDCRAALRGDRAAIDRARKVAASPRKHRGLSDSSYVTATRNCSKFLLSRGYITRTLGHEERNFPLAFSLLVYKDLEMVERLLRAIYRPQNFYCVHVDASADGEFSRGMSAVAGCLPNVILTSRRVNVVWGEFSVLRPELICMRELWRFKKWRYYINLTGQEFPLKTNLEMVRILKAYRGANDVQGTLKHANPERWLNSRPPHGIQPYKGSVHVAVNREFVRHILLDPKTRDLLRWTRRTQIPDETLFATMNHNPDKLRIRGSYTGDKMETKPTLTRYKNWWSSRPCAWKSVRDICILTVGDLPLLGDSRHLFANKFYLWHDRVVIECLEQKNFNRSRAGILGKHTDRLVDVNFYSNLEFVKHQLT